MRAEQASASVRTQQHTVSPRVWVLLGDKAGDNAQVEAVVASLPWVCESKYIQVSEEWAVAKPTVEPTLSHIDLSRSDRLEPPWPDLIITVGRRPSMVALWVRKQSDDRTKLVLIGKPSGSLAWFDLVVVSAEALLPPLANVLSIRLPLMRVDEAAVRAGAMNWQSRLDELPRPLIAVLVGGPTGPFLYNASVTARLLSLAHRIREQGGTPYITTSRRTPPVVVNALKAQLPAGAHLFSWVPDALENPYRGLLGLADGFVVTGDSVSMMVEVTRLRKPLAIFDLPTSSLGALDQVRRSLTRSLFAPATTAATDRMRRRVAQLLYRLRLFTQTRDFRGFHQLLIDQGLATREGQGFRAPEAQVPDDLPAVVERIQGLVADGRP